MDSPLEFSDYALRRMSQRNITREHVWYCINNHSKEEEYCPTSGEVVWMTKLPDGRNIKVRVRDGSKSPIFIIDTFSFK